MSNYFVILDKIPGVDKKKCQVFQALQPAPPDMRDVGTRRVTGKADSVVFVPGIELFDNDGRFFGGVDKLEDVQIVG